METYCDALGRVLDVAAQCLDYNQLLFVASTPLGGEMVEFQVVGDKFPLQCFLWLLYNN